jgi:hypothetical protein
VARTAAVAVGSGFTSAVGVSAAVQDARASSNRKKHGPFRIRFMALLLIDGQR